MQKRNPVGRRGRLPRGVYRRTAINFRLRSDLVAALRYYAEQNGVSVLSVVEHGIISALNEAG